MLKRIFAYILCLAAIMMLFSACSKEEKKTSNKKKNTAKVEATQVVPQESKQENEETEEQKKPHRDVREMMLEAGLPEIKYQAYLLHMNYIEPEDYILCYKTFEDAEKLINQYRYGGFINFYTFETYCDYVSILRTATGEESVIPRYAINDRLLFAERNISTYNKVEESIAILSVEGEIVLDWDPQWTDLDQCGDYFFLGTYVDGTYVCYVVNKEGEIITNLAYKTARYDIGQGYVFLCVGRGQIMSPQGEIAELREDSVDWTSAGGLYKGQELGKVSEGLFYGFSERAYVNVARYYSTTGETVIELSSHKINFKVTKMYDFSNGQAKIEFTGADNKNYYAFIDKTGAFIGEPVEMTQSLEEIPVAGPSLGGILK